MIKANARILQNPKQAAIANDRGNLTTLRFPISATRLQTFRRRKGGFHPLQSYRYVGSEELVKLMD
jgi:hypothetical protein